MSIRRIRGIAGIGRVPPVGTWSLRTRLLLGILVLSVGLRFAYDLVVPPTEPFTIRTTEEHQP